MVKRTLITGALLAVCAVFTAIAAATQASADANVDASSSSTNCAYMHDYHKYE